MSTSLIDNFDYRAARFLDSRQSVATLAALKAVPETSVPDGFRAYCTSTAQWYEFNSSNTPDAATGRWRPLPTLTSEITDDETTAPSNKAVRNAVYSSNFIFYTRAGIVTANDSVTIKAGAYYLVSKNREIPNRSRQVQEDITMAFEGNAILVLTQGFTFKVIRSASELEEKDIILLARDAVAGTYGGLADRQVNGIRTSAMCIGSCRITDGQLRAHGNFDVYVNGGFFKRFSDVALIEDISSLGTGTNSIYFSPAQNTFSAKYSDGAIIIGVCQGGMPYFEGNVHVLDASNERAYYANPTAAEIRALTSANNSGAFLICPEWTYIEVTDDAIRFPASTDIYWSNGSSYKFYRLQEAVEIPCTATGTFGIVWDYERNTFAYTTGQTPKDSVQIGVADVGKKTWFSGRYRLKRGSVIETSYFNPDLLIPTDDVPAFVMEEAEKTWRRFLTWQGGDDCLVFPIVTDVHTFGNTNYKHIGYAARTNRLFGYDFFANLGDTGIDGGTDTADTDYAILRNTVSEMMKYDGPVAVVCKGNHDYGKLPISTAVFTDSLQRPLIRRARMDVAYNATHACGYFDNGRTRIRVFFLNTSDGETGAYVMSKEQLRYLIDGLRSLPEGYHALILTHYCVDSCGKWNTWPNTSMSNHDIYLAILKAFVGKEAGSLNDVSWDFTEVAPSCRLIGNLCGDSHFDNANKVNGINFVISQGYGGVSEADRPEGCVYTPFDKSTAMLVDVVAVKPSQNKFKIFRIGAGGENCDREFTY